MTVHTTIQDGICLGPHKLGRKKSKFGFKFSSSPSPRLPLGRYDTLHRLVQNWVSIQTVHIITFHHALMFTVYA